MSKTSIVSIKRVANDGLQAEMIDYVQRPGAVNVLASLNKGDSRFNTGSPRHAWFPVTKESLVELGLSDKVIAKIDALQEGGKAEVLIEDPAIDGMKLKVQVNETVNPDAYQAANAAKAAKQIMINDKVAANKGLKTEYDLSKYLGQNGYFLDASNNYIFSRATVTIEGQVKHNFLDGFLVPEKELSTAGVILAPAISTKEVEA